MFFAKPLLTSSVCLVEWMTWHDNYRRSRFLGLLSMLRCSFGLQISAVRFVAPTGCIAWNAPLSSSNVSLKLLLLLLLDLAARMFRSSSRWQSSIVLGTSIGNPATLSFVKSTNMDCGGNIRNFFRGRCCCCCCSIRLGSNTLFDDNWLCQCSQSTISIVSANALDMWIINEIRYAYFANNQAPPSRWSRKGSLNKKSHFLNVPFIAPLNFNPEIASYHQYQVSRRARDRHIVACWNYNENRNKTLHYYYYLCILHRVCM